MSRKTIVLLGVVLIVIGFIAMVLLNDFEYGQLIGGLIVGAGGGCLSVLVAPKKQKN